MNDSDKVEFLRDCGLYDIAFRNAGVGFMFFDPPEGYKGPEIPDRGEWRKYLSVEHYYNTFAEAVEAEWQKRQAGTGDLPVSVKSG